MPKKLFVDLRHKNYFTRHHSKKNCMQSLDQVYDVISMDQISDIRLLGYDSDTETFMKIVYLVSSSMTISKIDISRNRLQENSVEVSENLSRSSSIVSINISNNWLENYGLKIT